MEAAAGVTGEAPAALAVIAQQPGGAVEELRRAIGRSHPATVRIVDRLVARGYLERRPAGRGPALALSVTATGRAHAREIIAARAQVLDAVLAELDDESAAALGDLLERLLGGLAELPEGIAVCRLCDKGRCRGSGDCPVVRRLEEQGMTLDPSEPLPDGGSPTPPRQPDA